MTKKVVQLINIWEAEIWKAKRDLSVNADDVDKSSAGVRRIHVGNRPGSGQRTNRFKVEGKVRRRTQVPERQTLS